MIIAILGATSQIASDYILQAADTGRNQLILFARQPDAVAAWLAERCGPDRFPVYGYEAFGDHEYDAILNFVGGGDPARIADMGASIFEITLEYDSLAIQYLSGRPQCRYIFMSSGVALWGDFKQPIAPASQATIPLNAVRPQDYYPAAKLATECRHRCLPHLAIVDLRLFSYVSANLNLAMRFLITDILRAIRSGSLLETAPDFIVRDYLHSADFFSLISCILAAPPMNIAIDSYSLAPVDKPSLLSAMRDNFGLRFEIAPEWVGFTSATGTKPYYYSTDRRAGEFAYRPTFSALDAVIDISRSILQR